MQNLQENKNTDNGGDQSKRDSSPSSRTIRSVNKKPTPIKCSQSKEKELINCGLHKLVSSFSIATKQHPRPLKILPNKKTEIDRPPYKLDPSQGRQMESSVTQNIQTGTNKHTMTDFDEKEPAKGKPYKDLQWTDPRLIKKYAHKSKKSHTIPRVDKTEYGSDILDSGSDDESEDKKNTNLDFLLKCLYYFCTTSVSFVGSMCGITLITMVLWKTLDENILNIYFDPPKHSTYLDTFKSAITSVTDIF